MLGRKSRFLTSARSVEEQLGPMRKEKDKADDAWPLATKIQIKEAMHANIYLGIVPARGMLISSFSKNKRR